MTVTASGFFIDRLDGVFLTHTHSDHVGGMETLASNRSVQSLYSSVFSQNKDSGENKIEEIARDLSLVHQKLRAGDRVMITDDVFFEVLGPMAFNAEDDNDNSLVMKLKAFGRTFLFAGDMQFAGEAVLLRSGIDLDADVLKVGNHGNSDATSEQFAGAVSPEHAVISTDTTQDADSANERVLTALRGANVYITENFACGVLMTVQKDGAIHVSSPTLPKTAANIVVTGIDRDMQTVTIKNLGPDIDISGFVLLSQREGEVFIFPEGSWLKSGQSVAVSSRLGSDYLWPGKAKVWHQEKDDSALLFDRFGNFLSSGN